MSSFNERLSAVERQLQEQKRQQQAEAQAEAVKFSAKALAASRAGRLLLPQVFEARDLLIRYDKPRMSFVTRKPGWSNPNLTYRDEHANGSLDVFWRYDIHPRLIGGKVDHRFIGWSARHGLFLPPAGQRAMFAIGGEGEVPIEQAIDRGAWRWTTHESHSGLDIHHSGAVDRLLQLSLDSIAVYLAGIRAGR